MFRLLATTVIFLVGFMAGAPAAVPPHVRSYLDNESHVVTEDRFLPSNALRSWDFVRHVVSHWRECLGNISETAPDVRRQCLIVVAGEFLPPPEYLLFAGHLCQLRKENKLSPEALPPVLWAGMAKSDFLAYNYNDVNVASLIGGIESCVTKDFPNEWEEYFQHLKSGRMREGVVERRQRDRDRMPESMSDWDSRSYQILVGGNMAADLRFAVTQPLNAVVSLAAKSRDNSYLIVIYVCFAGIAVGMVCGISKMRKRKFRKAS